MYQAEDYWERSSFIKTRLENLNNKTMFLDRNTLSTLKLIIKNHYKRKAKRPSCCTERWTQHWIRQWTIQKVSIYLAQTVMKRISGKRQNLPNSSDHVSPWKKPRLLAMYLINQYLNDAQLLWWNDSVSHTLFGKFQTNSIK